MDLIIRDTKKVCEYQKIERRLFNIESFDFEYAAFPKQVFNKRFDKVLFLEYNDWFHKEEDFQRLILFVKESGSTSFIASCPPFYLVNAINVPITTNHKDYVDNHTYSISNKEENKGVGIRKSPEAFYYDETEKWAMVSDLTHNIIIVGLNISLIKIFERIFEGKFTDIGGFVEELETFQGSKVDNKNDIINRFS